MVPPTTSTAGVDVCDDHPVISHSAPHVPLPSPPPPPHRPQLPPFLLSPCKSTLSFFKARQARRLPPCYALAMSGLPAREQLFNTSLCHDAGALTDIQVRRIAHAFCDSRTRKHTNLRDVSWNTNSIRTRILENFLRERTHSARRPWSIFFPLS